MKWLVWIAFGPQAMKWSWRYEVTGMKWPRWSDWDEVTGMKWLVWGDFGMKCHMVWNDTRYVVTLCMKCRMVWSALIWSDWYEVTVFPFGMKWLKKWSDFCMKWLGTPNESEIDGNKMNSPKAGKWTISYWMVRRK